MEIGQKIKQLRFKAGLTQEQLAERLNLSAQSVSKWENALSMPDISLLPEIAEVFGVSIDELFDLTREQKLRRLESRLEFEEELAPDVFRDYEEFLSAELQTNKDKQRVTSLIAQLYYHRLEADARRVSRYAREATMLAPEKKDCQWLLNKAEGAAVWDWNFANHAKVIEFFKEVVANDKVEPRSPLPYYYLIDNLLADNRIDEAEKYLEEFNKLPARNKFMYEVYKAHFELARHNEAKADAIIAEAEKKYESESGVYFEIAQYYARKCEYDKAIEYYEKNYAAEEDSKPRFTDPLMAIAMIHEIRGEYRKAADTYDRMIANMREEWGLTEELELVEAIRERDRLLAKK